jgi:hypothetical protein
MTGKRIPPPPMSQDGDRPSDLFDEPLETLPAAGGGEGEAPPPVGYANAPLHSRWKKGGPSPNPHGRPPKPRGGRLMEMMQQQVSIEQGGNARQMTRREALDRIVRDRAIAAGGRWLKLWDRCQARDQQLRQRVDAWHERLASDPEMSRTARRIRADSAAGDRLIQFIDTHFAGVMETHMRLIGMGAIIDTPDGIRLANGASSVEEGNNEMASLQLPAPKPR